MQLALISQHALLAKVRSAERDSIRCIPSEVFVSQVKLVAELCPDRCSRCSDFKSLIKQKFDARTSYDKDNERHPTLAAQLVKRSNLRLGWQVLDLACGSGLVTYLAAADVGSAGFVTYLQACFNR